MFNVDSVVKNLLNGLNLEEIKKSPLLSSNGHLNTSLTEHFTSLIQNKVGDGFLVEVIDFRLSKNFSQIFIEVLEFGKLDESCYVLVTVNKTTENIDSDIEVSFNQFTDERINEIVKETDIRHIYDIAKAILDNKIL